MLYAVPNPALAPAASAPFSSRTRNALAIFLAFAVPAHRGVLVVVVVGALGGMAVYSGEETLKKEGAKKGGKEGCGGLCVPWCECGTCTSICAFVCGECDRARLAHKLRDAAAATDVSLPLLSPSLPLSPRHAVLPGCLARYIPSYLAGRKVQICFRGHT